MLFRVGVGPLLLMGARPVSVATREIRSKVLWRMSPRYFWTDLTFFAILWALPSTLKSFCCWTIAPNWVAIWLCCIWAKLAFREGECYMITWRRDSSSILFRGGATGKALWTTEVSTFANGGSEKVDKSCTIVHMIVNDYLWIDVSKDVVRCNLIREKNMHTAIGNESGLFCENFHLGASIIIGARTHGIDVGILHQCIEDSSDGRDADLASLFVE